ncbi:MAG: hypothetical protein IJ834_01815 [Paludibacteraceae bacterium]|nr:hypothetical protein [Paludibacteraceae bacterium]
MLELSDAKIENEQDVMTFLTHEGKQLWEYPLQTFSYIYRKDGMAAYATEFESLQKAVIDPAVLLQSCFENGNMYVLTCECHYPIDAGIYNMYVYHIDDSVFWLIDTCVWTEEDKMDEMDYIFRFDKQKYTNTVKRLITELYNNPKERRDLCCDYWYPRGSQLESLYKKAQTL